MNKQMSPFEAEKIINALRDGVAPSSNLRELSVGRENWLDSVMHDLNVVVSGASRVRFLSAPWGGGKTHFLQLVKEGAVEHNFIVSYVVLHSREAPLDRFEIVFPKIMRGLIFPDGGGLESALDAWASNFTYYSEDEMGAELRRLSPSLDFRAALRACLSHCKGDALAHRQTLRDVAGWLQGDSLSPSLKKQGVHNTVKITNVAEILGAFLRFLVSEKYSGLVMMLDEAQAVTSLSQSKRRDEANQNLRKLLDNADEHIGLYIIFATTPQFLTDPSRGAKSYPALWSRIRDVVSSQLTKPSKRSLIIPLEPLSLPQLTDLGSKVSKIHSIAYEWNPYDYLDSEDIKQFVEKFTRESENPTVRSFIKPLVYILDRIEEAKEASLFDSLLDQIKFQENEDIEE